MARHERYSSLSLSKPPNRPILFLLHLLVEAFFCHAIIQRVPFTDIDLHTYFQQADAFLHGQRDYAFIKGDTGPVVYPAGHVYFYALIRLLAPERFQTQVAQYVFAGLYLTSLASVLLIFRRAKMPAWSMLFLSGSKRLHSIYVLRCFNDGLAMAFMYPAILACTQHNWITASLLYSLALSVKMNILLFLPAFVFLSVLSNGVLKTSRNLSIVALVQVLLSLPFTLHNAPAYLHNAFQFSRAFLYQWTVNWRMLPEDVFSSRALSSTLLFSHLVLLFQFSKRWSKPHGGLTKVILRSLGGPSYPATLFPSTITPTYTMKVFATANLIGILCARSLHYQFYAWYAWQTVFLAVKSRGHWSLRLLVAFLIESVWNVYPPTPISSTALLACHIALLSMAYIAF